VEVVYALNIVLLQHPAPQDRHRNLSKHQQSQRLIEIRLDEVGLKCLEEEVLQFPPSFVDTYRGASDKIFFHLGVSDDEPTIHHSPEAHHSVYHGKGQKCDGQVTLSVATQTFISALPRVNKCVGKANQKGAQHPERHREGEVNKRPISFQAGFIFPNRDVNHCRGCQDHLPRLLNIKPPCCLQHCVDLPIRFHNEGKHNAVQRGIILCPKWHPVCNAKMPPYPDQPHRWNLVNG